MKNVLKENERIDDLEYKGLKLIQNKEWFCFGMDAVLLSDFAKDIKPNSRVLDLGTGTGIIGILLCAKTKLKEIIGIEIQKEVADLARRNVLLNNLEERMKVIEADIRELNQVWEKEKYDVIVTNPPYKKINTGAQNENENKLISRHEIKCNLEDIIKVSNKLLKDNGKLYMVHRPERLVDICQLLRKYKIEPKEIRLVYPHQNEAPNLVLIKAVKGANAFLKILSPLVVYGSDEKYTKEIMEIYHKIEK